MTRTEGKSRSGAYILAAAAIILAAVVFLLANPLKADAAESDAPKADSAWFELCDRDISNYNDNQWHSPGSAAISGWKGGRFKLSTDRSTLYLDGFKYWEDGEYDCCYMVRTNHNLKIHVTGENTFEDSDLAILVAGSKYQDLEIEGEPGSSLTVGPPSWEDMMAIQNLTISGCDFTFEKTLYANGSLTVQSGSVNAVDLITPTLNMKGGSLILDRVMEIHSLLNQTGGTINAIKIDADDTLTASGGAMTATNNINIGGDATISGGSVTAKKFGVWVGGVLKITDGKLISTNTGSSGPSSGVKVLGDVILSGGELIVTNTGNTSGALYTNSSVKVSGGYLYAYCQAGPGIDCANFSTTGFSMTGGTVVAVSGANGSCGFVANNSEPALTNGVWIANPADGYIKKDNISRYMIYNSSDQLAREVWFAKAKSISVKQSPSADYYSGDVFDPAGLVLEVTYDLNEEDRDVLLTYNDRNKQLFAFDPADMVLSAGTNQIVINCLNKATLLAVSAKDFAAPEITANSAANGAELNWEAVDAAESYDVYAGEAGGQMSCIGTTTDPGYTDTTIRPGDKRSYQVRAVRTNNKGQKVEARSNTVNVSMPLADPQLMITPGTYDSVTLMWNAVDGADCYELYRSTEGDSDFSRVLLTSERGTVDKGLVTGAEYTYYVVAVNSISGIRSGQSPHVSTSTSFEGRPKITQVVNTGSGYELTWTAVPGANNGYEIWRGKGESGARSLLAEVDEGTTKFKDGSADSYASYNYLVKPRRLSGSKLFYGGDSNVAIGKALPPKPVVTPPKTDDPTGTKFILLQARAGKITKNSVQLLWRKVPGAKKYVIYGNKCGTKNKYKKLTTTTKLKLTYKKVAGKKVKKGTYYKFIVYALNSKGKVISTSKTVHVATTGGKVGNDKKVTTAAKKNKVTIKKGKTFKLKAKAIQASKKLKVQRHRKMAYETSNKKIATVSSKGVIKGKSKGTCYVYAYTQNGKFAKVKVTVK